MAVLHFIRKPSPLLKTMQMSLQRKASMEKGLQWQLWHAVAGVPTVMVQAVVACPVGPALVASAGWFGVNFDRSPGCCLASVVSIRFLCLVLHFPKSSVSFFSTLE